MKIYLDTKEASIFLRRSPVTLKGWRWKKIGPIWNKDPFGKPMYYLKDLENWVETQERNRKLAARQAAEKQVGEDNNVD